MNRKNNQNKSRGGSRGGSRKPYTHRNSHWNSTPYGSWDYMTPNVEKKSSGYTIAGVDGYKETDDFKDAIAQHNSYIINLNEAMDRAKERIAILTEAQNQKVYYTPSEYDDYQISKAKQEQIEKRRQELERQEAARKAKEEERVQKQKAEEEKINDKYRTKIKEKFEYAMRCAEYLGNDRIYCNGASDDITEDMTIEMCLNNVEDYPVYWDNIKNVIKEAHEAHNDNLTENDTTEYDCPGCYGYDDPWDEDADSCYALASDGRTHGCGKKVYWDTSNVDFLKDLTLDSTTPEGYIAAY